MADDTAPNIVYPQPSDCPPAQQNDSREVVPCVVYDWEVKLALSPNAVQLPADITVPTDPNAIACMQAVPEQNTIYAFHVARGTFRRVHIEWPLTPWCPKVKIMRIYRCGDSCCDSGQVFAYEVSGCPLFLPAGDYEISLEPTDVCAPASSAGAEYAVRVWLEYVTRDYLDAYMASGGNACTSRCG